jgi:hypothetical protein
MVDALATAALGVTWTLYLSALASVALGLDAMRLPPALTQPHVLATPLAVPLSEGWTRLDWVPAVQGPLDPTAIRTADDYLNDPPDLYVSGSIATGSAHTAVVVTDLATQHDFYWGYVGVDTAPGMPPASTSRRALR